MCVVMQQLLVCQVLAQRRDFMAEGGGLTFVDLVVLQLLGDRVLGLVQIRQSQLDRLQTAPLLHRNPIERVRMVNQVGDTVLVR